MLRTLSTLAALLLSLGALAQGSQPPADLPGMTPAETAAIKTWNLRAALNVAALQCQWSPYLRTVDRYNAMLKQHAKELNGVRITLDKAFTRVGGAKQGPRDFDRFNTRLYQSYATMTAAEGFCRSAAEAGRDALLQPLGKLSVMAPDAVTKLRAAMVPTSPQFLVQMEYSSFPEPFQVCWDRKRKAYPC